MNESRTENHRSHIYSFKIARRHVPNTNLYYTQRVTINANLIKDLERAKMKYCQTKEHKPGV